MFYVRLNSHQEKGHKKYTYWIIFMHVENHLQVFEHDYSIFFKKDMYFLEYSLEIVKIEKFDLAPQCFKLKTAKCIEKLVKSTFTSKIVFLISL